MNRKEFDTKLIELLENPEISKEQAELLQMMQKLLSYIDEYRALIPYYSSQGTSDELKEAMEEFESRALNGTEAAILLVRLKKMSDNELQQNKKNISGLGELFIFDEKNLSSAFGDVLKNKENRINSLEDKFNNIPAENNNIRALYTQALKEYQAIKKIQSERENVSEESHLLFDLKLIKHADSLEGTIKEIEERNSMLDKFFLYKKSISDNIKFLKEKKNSKKAGEIQKAFDEIQKEKELKKRLSSMEKLYEHAIAEAGVFRGVLDKNKPAFALEYESELKKVDSYLELLKNAKVKNFEAIKKIVEETKKDVKNKIKKNGILADYEEAFKTLEDLHIKMKNKFERHLLKKSKEGQVELEAKEEKARKEQEKLEEKARKEKEYLEERARKEQEEREEAEKKQSKKAYEKDLFMTYVETRFALIEKKFSELSLDLEFLKNDKNNFIESIKKDPSFDEEIYKNELKGIEKIIKSKATEKIKDDFNDKRNKVSSEIASLENRLNGLKKEKIESDIAVLKNDKFITHSSFKVEGMEGLISLKKTIDNSYHAFMNKINKIKQNISYHESVISAINKAKLKNDFTDFFDIITNEEESLKNIINDYLDEAFKKSLLGDCRSPVLIRDDRFELIKKKGIFDQKTIEITQKIRDIKHKVDCRNLSDQDLIDIINFQTENNISILDDKLFAYLDKYHNEPSNLQELKNISKRIIEHSPQIKFNNPHIKNLNKMIFENDDLQVILKKIYEHKDAKMEAWMVVLLNENKDFCHQLKEHFENDKSDGSLLIEIMRSFFSLPLEDPNKKVKNQLAAEKILSGVYGEVSSKGKDPRKVLKKLLSESHGKFSWEDLFQTLERVEILDKKIIDNTRILVQELNKKFRASGMASDEDIKHYRKRAINLVLTHAAEKKTLKETEEGLLGLSEAHFDYGSSKSGTLKTIVMDVFRFVDELLKKLSLPPINFFSKLKTQSAVQQEIKEIFKELPANKK